VKGADGGTVERQQAPIMFRRSERRRTQVGERSWLVTFRQYDLGYFDDETCRLEPIENPFGPKPLPIRPK